MMSNWGRAIAPTKKRTTMKTFYCVATTIKDNGQCSCKIIDSIEAETKPESKYKSTSRADYYTDWFGTLEEAQKFVETSKIR